MIVDSSALVAIIRLEKDAAVFATALARESMLAISAATVLEASMVLLGRAAVSSAFFDVDSVIRRSSLIVEPVTHEDALSAREAFRIYGKGRHPAGLNFGDCFTYALARRLNRPILCKGNDFAQTDALVVRLAS